jgi:hypothetical protein
MRGMLAVSLLVAGCATHPSPGVAPAPQPGSRQRLWGVADTLALSRSASITRYGRPVRIEADTVRNFNEPEIVDSIVHLTFPHFEAVYVVHADHSVMLQHITIKTPAPVLPPQVRPGMSRDSLVAYLGAPDADEELNGGRILLYELQHNNTETLGNVLNVFLVRNRVRWISWVFEPERRVEN